MSGTIRCNCGNQGHCYFKLTLDHFIATIALHTIVAFHTVFGFVIPFFFE
jgi:hypothetical protein